MENPKPFRMNKMAKLIASVIVKYEQQRIIYDEKGSRIGKKVFMYTESISNVSDTIKQKGRARNPTFLPSSFLQANNHNVASTTKTTFFIPTNSCDMNTNLTANHPTYRLLGFRPHPRTQTLYVWSCRNDPLRLPLFLRSDSRLATSLRP